MTGFWLFIGFCIYQGSKYTRVTQESKKNAAYRCLAGFQIFFRFWRWHSSKYARVTQSSAQYCPLYISDRIQNMPLILKWQSYRLQFYGNCILEIRRILNILNMPQYTKILHVSGILICWSFTRYIERVLNILRALNMPEFSIWSGYNLKKNVRNSRK